MLAELAVDATLVALLFIAIELAIEAELFASEAVLVAALAGIELCAELVLVVLSELVAAEAVVAVDLVVVELSESAAEPAVVPAALVGATAVVGVVAALAVTGLTSKAAPNALLPIKTTIAVHHFLPDLYSR